MGVTDHSPGGCTDFRQVVPTFVAAFRAGDVDALCALYHPDAVLYDVRGIARGGSEIRAAWEHFAAAIEVLDYEILQREERAVGDGHAYGHMTMVATLRSRANGATTRSQGRSTEIMRRGDDGRWRFAVDHASVEAG